MKKNMESPWKPSVSWPKPTCLWDEAWAGALCTCTNRSSESPDPPPCIDSFLCQCICGLFIFILWQWQVRRSCGSGRRFLTCQHAVSMVWTWCDLVMHKHEQVNHVILLSQTDQTHIRKVYDSMNNDENASRWTKLWLSKIRRCRTSPNEKDSQTSTSYDYVCAFRFKSFFPQTCRSCRLLKQVCSCV